MAWDELELHRFLAAEVLPPRVEGRTLSHDAVVTGGHAVCCDRTEEGVHFRLEGAEAAPLDWVARKAVGRVLSDLAATAARPTGIVAAVAAPATLDQDALKEFLAALGRWGTQWGAPLLGGDLTATVGAGLSVVVTGWGTAPMDPPGRDRLKAGDVVAVSGPVGGSRGGRHLQLSPRVALGQRAHAAGVRAMMDVSDGLALDLHRLALASGLAIQLDGVPVHSDVTAKDKTTRLRSAMFDGEDHELLLGLPAERSDALCAELELIPLGRTSMANAPGLWIREPLEERGLAGTAGVPTDAQAVYSAFDPSADTGSGGPFVHGRERKQ